MRGPSVAACLLTLLLFPAAPASPQDGRVLSMDPFVRSPARLLPPVGPDLSDASLAPVWRGLRVAEGHDCPPFDVSDYRPADRRPRGPVLPPLGSVGGRDPLSCADPAAVSFDAPRPEAVRYLPVEEAHRRGLCVASPSVRRLYAADSAGFVPGLVLPSFDVLRSSVDPAWVPPVNACWYVARRVDVHRRWGLSIPPAEAMLFDGVLRLCSSEAMAAPTCGDLPPVLPPGFPAR